MKQRLLLHDKYVSQIYTQRVYMKAVDVGKRHTLRGMRGSSSRRKQNRGARTYRMGNVWERESI